MIFSSLETHKRTCFFVVGFALLNIVVYYVYDVYRLTGVPVSPSSIISLYKSIRRLQIFHRYITLL